VLPLKAKKKGKSINAYNTACVENKKDVGISGGY
jgi:hypothetical protein